MTQFDKFNITKWYLYGQNETPENLVDSSLIRIKSASVEAPSVDLEDFMTTGAGRFAVGSQFELIQRFFSLNVPEGEYSKNELFYDVFGLGTFDPNAFFGWKMQQFNYDDFIGDNPETEEIETSDYLDRVWVYNTMSFKISDEAIFIVDSDGNKKIDDFAIRPISNTEDFDFESSNSFTEIANAVVLPSIDPSGIGRKVEFNYTDFVPLKTYTEADFERDFEESQSWKVSTPEAFLRIGLLKDEFVNDLFEEGVIRFLDENNKPIIYGTLEDDILFAAIASKYPTLKAFKDNGVTVISADGNDNLFGALKDDRLIAGEGEDTLIGNRGNDLLEGGNQNDTLDGSKGDRDTAVFSDVVNNYTISSSISVFGSETFTITHNTGEEGTDTLRNIELAQFSDGVTDLIDGSFNTTSAEAPSTSTNFFDPGIPVNLNFALPVSTIDGDAEYSLNISQIEANPQYNIAFIIDTSASMSVDPTDFQNVKDAHTDLIDYFKDNGIAENTNFGVVSFSRNATLYEDLSADEAIGIIQGLSVAPAIEGTQYRQALGKGIDFFTQSPLNGENVTNLAYFVSDGRSRSTYPEPTYHNNARFLRSVANVQAFGIYDETNPASAVTDGQINFVDSEQGVIINESSELTTAFSQSGLIDDVEEIKIFHNDTVVATIDPSELTDTPFGLNYTGSINNLDVNIDAANDIKAEVSFIDNSAIASSSLVDFTISSSLDNSGAEPLTTIAEGSVGDEEMILGSIDLGANGNEGNDKLVGNNFGNLLDGGAGNDSIYGHNGNDTLIGGAGEDLIDGGNDIDTVNYLTQTFASAVIEQKGDVTKINDLDTLINVEYLQFSDVRVDANTLEVVPILSGTDITVTEGDEGNTTAQFTLNLDTPATNTVQFNYETIDLDAVEAEDYTAALGTITIPSGSTSATIDVEIVGDTEYEFDETFILNLSAISGATFMDYEEEYTLFANITNDDSEPTSDPEPPTTQIIAEYGVIDNLTHELQTINLSNSFTNPVVFAQPLSYNGSDPSIVRLQNIDSDRFSLFIQESSNFDGTHTTEQVSYLVLESGTWQLPNGDTLQTGTLESNELISANWQSIGFTSDYDSVPAVFTQVQTNNDPDFIQTRQRNITNTGFEFGMEEEEATKDSTHGTEQLGWFALPERNGNWNGNDYRAGTTEDVVTHDWSAIEFNSDFSAAPQLFASLATYDGPDPARLRYQNLGTDRVEIKIEEDTTVDSETDHTTEQVSFFALEGSGLLEASAIVEALPVIESADVTVTEGDTGTKIAQFSFYLSDSSTNEVVFDFSTEDINAVAGEDYIAASGTVVIPAGNTTGTVNVEIVGDTNLELDETFKLNLSGIESATFADNRDKYSVLGTIANDDTAPVMGEYGVINDLTHELQTISLGNSFTNPVVFVQPLSFNGGDPSIVRLQNIDSDRFSLFIQESSNFDGTHTTEQVSYLVLESGTWQLPNGDTLQVGTVESDELISADWQSIGFTETYDSIPAVFSQVQTNNDSDFVQTRQRNITKSGFEFGMEEEEATKDSTHGTEQLGWFALESGSGNWSGNDYQAGTTEDTVTHNWSTIEFNSNFSAAPQLFASLATYDGADPARLRYQNLDSNNVEIKVEEDTTLDSETSHTTEQVSFLALEGAGLLEAEAVPLLAEMDLNVIKAETSRDDLTRSKETLVLENSNPMAEMINETYQDVKSHETFDLSFPIISESSFANNHFENSTLNVFNSEDGFLTDSIDDYAFSSVEAEF